MSNLYHLNAADGVLLAAAKRLLQKAAEAEATKPAEIVSIAKLQQVLSLLPKVTSGVDVKVSVVSPCRHFGGSETFHWWDVAVENEQISISSGGHLFRPGTGGDTFMTIHWTADPGFDSELGDYRNSLATVPDVGSFLDGVASIDLNVPGFRVKVTDEDNPLLHEVDDCGEHESEAIDNEDFGEDDEQGQDQDNPSATRPIDDLTTQSSANDQTTQRFNERALDLLADGDFEKVESLLKSVLDNMPADWKPVKERAGSVQIAFWDGEEFFAHVTHVKSRPLQKTVFWVQGSYSHAWNILAVVASKRGLLEHALLCLECGIELEPDHPELWSEKGFVLGKLKRHKEALQCYVKAATVRDWAPAEQIARALRGQGIQLVDLKRLDEAEDALHRSLEFEPESETAKGELEYIAQLRKQQTESEQLPWFLRALAEPPTDPLTAQLLVLVEGLPPIAGPKTVGSENYSRISEAFLAHGWTGFEEEFNQIVNRGRPDYAQVKRDLLREPIFSAAAHRNLARGLAAHVGLSDESFEDVMDDINRKAGDRKHQ